jgi:hypothetical protein
MGDLVAHGEAAPTVEVRVYRYGALISRIWCESEDAATAEVDKWSELDGVECEIDDLSFRHRPGDVFEPEPAVDLTVDEEDPALLETDGRHRAR